MAAHADRREAGLGFGATIDCQLVGRARRGRRGAPAHGKVQAGRWRWRAPTSRCGTRWRLGRYYIDQAPRDRGRGGRIAGRSGRRRRPIAAGPDHADRERARPRRQGVEDPGPADPRRDRPRGRRGPRSPTARGRGAAGRRSRPVDDDRRRPGPLARPVHLADGAGGDVHEAADGDRRTEASGRPPAMGSRLAATTDDVERLSWPHRMGLALDRVDRAVSRRPAALCRRAHRECSRDHAAGNDDGRPGRSFPRHGRKDLAGSGEKAAAARPGSSRPSSAAARRSSTSDASTGSTPVRNGSRSAHATSTAPPRAATGRPGSVTCTTTSRGSRAVAPASRRAGSSAPGTTPWPTTRATPLPPGPAARSPSPGARKPTGALPTLGSWDTSTRQPGSHRRPW